MALKAQTLNWVQDQQRSHREIFIPAAEFTGHLRWAWPRFGTWLQAGTGCFPLKSGDADQPGPALGTRGTERTCTLEAVSCQTGNPGLTWGVRMTMTSGGQPTDLTHFQT